MAAEALSVWLNRAGVEFLALELLELGLLLVGEHGECLFLSFGRDLVELLLVSLPLRGLDRSAVVCGIQIVLFASGFTGESFEFGFLFSGQGELFSYIVEAQSGYADHLDIDFIQAGDLLRSQEIEDAAAVFCRVLFEFLLNIFLRLADEAARKWVCSALCVAKFLKAGFLAVGECQFLLNRLRGQQIRWVVWRLTACAKCECATSILAVTSVVEMAKIAAANSFQCLQDFMESFLGFGPVDHHASHRVLRDFGRSAVGNRCQLDAIGRTVFRSNLQKSEIHGR